MAGRGPVHRICRKCGERWNVSSIEPGEKVYICPWCDYKIKQAEKAKRNANRKKVERCKSRSESS